MTVWPALIAGHHVGPVRQLPHTFPCRMEGSGRRPDTCPQTALCNVCSACERCAVETEWIQLGDRLGVLLFVPAVAVVLFNSRSRPGENSSVKLTPPHLSKKH